MSDWQVVLLEPAKAVLAQISQFLVNLLLVVIILIIGWIISKVIKAMVTQILRAVKLDVISDRIELDNLLAKGGIKYSLSELIGVICYWLALLVTFVVAINAIGLTVAADLLNRIVLYIPNVIVGIFILIMGIFVATLLKNIVQTAASNVGLAQASFLANLTEVLIVTFAVLMTLEQLKIGVRVTEITVSIVLGSIGLGLALAFGLGCKDIMAKLVAEVVDKLKKK
ncbi:MAG: hypothetical protein FJZ13_00385 [Candidatus Omnitrophica bacterium]|nr:hypothetical protein [Candidatus Omnitrophota bacterium]